MYDIEGFCVKAISELKSESKIEFREGLSKSKILSYETEFDCKFPPELKVFLEIAVPVGHGWPKWHGRASDLVRGVREFFEYVFRTAIRDDYAVWVPSRWGIRPTDDKEAVSIALQDIRSLPPLIPIYKIRHIPSFPAKVGNPIYSIYSPYDSVVYGVDFPEYLHNEFGVSVPEDHTPHFRAAPHWHDLLTTC